jgi:hypothetical protein
MNFVLQPWHLLLAIGAVGVAQVGGCGIATPASRRLVSVHNMPRRRAEIGERPGGRVKTESIFLFPSVANRILGLDAFAFAPRGVAHWPFWR